MKVDNIAEVHANSRGADISPDASAIDWDGTRPWSYDDLEPAVRETCDHLHNATAAGGAPLPVLISLRQRHAFLEASAKPVEIGR